MNVVDMDNAIYAQVDKISGSLDENVCYGIHETKTTTAESNLDENEKVTASKSRSCNKMCLAFALVLLMLCAVSVCTSVAAFVQISRLYSELASIQNSTSLSNQTTESTAFQEALALTNNSIQMRFSQDLSMIESQTMALIQNYTERSGLYQNYPAASCGAILQFVPSSPSGHYWIRSSNGSAVRVYCDMTRSCGNITGGWMRVAELDMRDSSSQCPSALRMGTACNPTRTCVINSDNANCSSVSFSTHGFNYSRVCGMIRAYQVGTPDAFGNHGEPMRLRNSPTLDSNYVDGISLTHGLSPRQHIWTFAAIEGIATCSYCDFKES